MNASRIIHLFLIIFLASLQASPSFAGDLDTALYSRWPVTPPAIQVNDPTAVAALCTGAQRVRVHTHLDPIASSTTRSALSQVPNYHIHYFPRMP